MTVSWLYGLNTVGALLGAALAGYVLAGAEEQTKLDEFDELYKNFSSISAEVRAASRKNTNKQAFELSRGKGQAAFDQAAQAMRAIAETADQAMVADSKATDAAYASATLLMYAVGGIGILLAGALGFVIIRVVAGPNPVGPSWCSAVRDYKNRSYIAVSAIAPSGSTVSA